jgi:ubiquinone/menaquinone biosynthesis C-methylase UbiE
MPCLDRFNELLSPYESQGLDRAVGKILSELSHQPGVRALEIGCGTGKRASLLAKMGFQVTALDISQEMLERARVVLGNKVELALCDAHDLPYEDDSFHISCLFLTLGFVREPVKVVKEAFRVAKQMVIIAEINLFSALALKVSYEKLLYPGTYLPRIFSASYIKGLIRKQVGFFSLRTIKPFHHPFSSICIYVSDLYHDRIIVMNPIALNIKKRKLAENFSLTYNPRGGQDEGSLPLPKAGG